MYSNYLFNQENQNDKKKSVYLHNCNSITSNAVKKTISKAKEKLQPALFENLKFHVTGSFSNFNANTPESDYLNKNYEYFTETRGICLVNSKEIFIQDMGYYTAFDSITPNLSKQISTDTMHELGHYFDNFYGEHNDKDIIKIFKEKVLPKYFTDEEFTKEDEKIDKIYYANNEYSDTEEFKNALLKDLQNTDLNKLLEKFRYYALFFLESPNNIMLPTKENIEEREPGRCEIFAQTFAYAMGEEDESKEEWLKTFPTVYALVKEYIKKHSKQAYEQ